MSGCSQTLLLFRTISSQRWIQNSHAILLRRRAGSSAASTTRTRSFTSTTIRTDKPANEVSSINTSTVSNSDHDYSDVSMRVNDVYAFPNEYPGQIYAFNWCLNGDGVTPLKKSSFRITKPLDLKVAGLELPATNPLKVTPASSSSIPEAGSDELSFEQFDEVSTRTRDLLSLSDHLYCPEGHVPGTRTAARVITNSPTLAPDLLAYLDRAPRKEPPDSLPITVYILEGVTEEEFCGYAIEEMEVQIPSEEDPEWATGNEPMPECELKSVASVVVVAPKPDLSVIVAGIEFSQKALAADEIERASKKKQ